MKSFSFVALLVFCVPYRLFTAPAAQPSGESENLRNNSITIPASHDSTATSLSLSAILLLASLWESIMKGDRSTTSICLGSLKSGRLVNHLETRHEIFPPPRENDGFAEGIFPFHFCTSPCSFSRSSLSYSPFTIENSG